MDTYRPGDKDGPCHYCQRKNAERKPPAPPPCDSCRVELMEENEDAARIFNAVQGQVLTRFNGKYDVVTDINQLAVWAAIDAYGVRDRTGCFEKVCRLFFAMLKEQRESE